MDSREESSRGLTEVLGRRTEVGYLEQLGTLPFKESALRKQLVCLKFGPFLKGIPHKLVLMATEISSIHDAPSLPLEVHVKQSWENLISWAVL